MRTGDIMKNYYGNMPDGYRESISRGIAAVRTMANRVSYGTGTREERITRLMNEIATADAVVVGAGAGLSTAAGLTYSGDRFMRYFSDFARRFGIKDMYSGGFYPFPDEETKWAWWSRHIYFNRYVDAPKPVYSELLSLLTGKEYFVITTNVDHQFQRAGFDEKKLFCTQGDYGLFQRPEEGADETFSNEEWTMQAMQTQGFVRDENGEFRVPEDGRISMRIPSFLIPAAPDGGAVSMNLRSDDTFAEDEEWHRASASYAEFLERCRDRHVLYLEIGVGSNTPVIIKYPFWAMTMENEKAVYACLNFDEAYCPAQIEDRSVIIDGDTAEVLEEMIRYRK